MAVNIASVSGILGSMDTKGGSIPQPLSVPVMLARADKAQVKWGKRGQKWLERG